MSKTVTRERVEVTETELTVCEFCDQPTEEDNLVTVGVDLHEVSYRHGTREKPVEKRPLCKHCADAIFDYERPSTTAGETVRPVWEARPDDDFFAKVGYITVMLLVGVCIISLWMFGFA